ncbi:MAG TPA: trans-aconitate 2-methyltransferase [Pseudonocardiaceae bacterium]
MTGGSAVRWDPAAYLRVADERARPFHDLLARVGAAAPRRVVDLGCGPGTLTVDLARRWPDAAVTGLDSSPEMVAAARAAGVSATTGDVTDWTPGPADDVVVCNAVLQWVPGHLDLVRRWASALTPGGWLAFQVPGNFAAPSHVAIRTLAADPRWAGRLGGLLRDEDAVHEPAVYAEALAAAGLAVDVWETTYLHRLTGEDPVLTWVTGTALRPVRTILDDDEWAAFTTEVAPRLRADYPPAADGTTWFPFRRILAVAHRAP